MGKGIFKLESEWAPAGDQPEAIKQLVAGLKKGMRKQTLLGATGTGKTFTMANVIQQHDKPTLIIAHNKTLAAQLAQEFREFFPSHAVHYFVSYYDFYQPEAYLPVSDTFIEKDAQINKEIDRLRHATTQSLLLRKDVIIVASVSCIYGLGSPAEYEKVNMKLTVGMEIDRTTFMRRLLQLHFTRTNADLEPGTFRTVGNKVDIMPISETMQYQFAIGAKGIESITKIDPVSSKTLDSLEAMFIFPAKHFITNESQQKRAIKSIEAELKEQLKKFENEGKLLEAERLKRRTTYDLAMIKEIGYCNGIENYSRHLSGKLAGEPPETLLSYFPHTADGTPDFLTIIDESHVTLPQIQGMFAGDQARKKNLVEFGFRLPSACDNRPLQYPEFEERTAETVYVSATPADREKDVSGQIVQQIIRPTGLIDPEVIVRPILEKGSHPGQIQDFIKEAIETVRKGDRVLATTLTKKMAEDLATYLKEKGIKAEYLHSEITTIDRIRILTQFRKGEFDVLVGVNLLREGLDLPEVSFIGILDADKEGFLRSETSLIQTIGRAARNVNGRVILYADIMTGSMEKAIGETNRRRAVQMAYNTKHGITPQTIKKAINDIAGELYTDHEKALSEELAIDIAKIGAKGVKAYQKLIKVKEKEMTMAVKELDFETAAILRDEIKALSLRMAE